ncbi:MAG TPA: FkbM family methyltransferase [Bacteroidia bacterium]|jgi:FkbM family methyltransferase|nr:FkbM family methyltransferase [Bacteroidia bacterium]
MLANLIGNLTISGNAGKTSAEKLSAFWLVLKLHFKIRFNGKKSSGCDIKIFGYKIHGSSYNGLLYLFKEIFILHEYKPKYATYSKPLIIDCGANIGCATLYFKRLFPESQIICFEAYTPTFMLLEKNITGNKIEGVTIYNKALAANEGEISFFITEDENGLINSALKGRGVATEIKVPSVKLSGFIKESGIVNLVKMDVEGSETAIIDELIESGTLGKVDEYIIEYHHNLNNNSQKLPGFLTKFETQGFKYSLRAGFQEPGSVQDILIHFYKEK